MLKSIRIENPVSGCRLTTKNRAKRFVSQGRAVWIESGVSIRFVASDHRHRAAQESADMTSYWYERAAHAGMAQLSELANHGFPARIRIPRQRSMVHVLVKDGMPCDEFVEVIIPAKTIGMRDARRRPTNCANPGRIGR